MLVIVWWPLAIPALLFAMLYRFRVQLRAEDEDASAMSNFLIADYTPEYVSNCIYRHMQDFL